MEFYIPQVSTIRASLRAKTIETILTIGQVITGDIFAIRDHQVSADRLFPYTAVHLLCQFHHFPRTEIKFLQFRIVLFFCELFIEEAMPFVAEIAAHETIHTSATVEEECRGCTFRAEEQIATVLALLALDTLIEERALRYLHTVHTVIRGVATITVHQILRLMSASAHVAVFALAHVVIEIAVLREFHAKRGQWSAHHQFGKLNKERHVEIVWSSVRESIERIAIPMVFLAYLVRVLGREYGDNVLIRHVTATTVEMALIAEAHSPLLSTSRADCRRRDQFFLAAEYRRELVVERQIVFRDLKC